MKKFLVKLLKRRIFKNYLFLALIYFLLLLSAVLILFLGFSPEIVCGFILKEVHNDIATILLLFGGVAITGLSFYLICTHSKIEAVLSFLLESVKETHNAIDDNILLIRCIKKSGQCALTAYEENKLNTFLAKMKISKAEFHDKS